jgi:hypothetical protein
LLRKAEREGFGAHHRHCRNRGSRFRSGA